MNQSQCSHGIQRFAFKGSRVNRNPPARAVIGICYLWLPAVSYNGYQIALPWSENLRLMLHGRLSLNILSHLNPSNFYNIKQTQVPPNKYCATPKLEAETSKCERKSERHSWGWTLPATLTHTCVPAKGTQIAIATTYSARKRQTNQNNLLQPSLMARDCKQCSSNGACILLALGQGHPASKRT